MARQNIDGTDFVGGNGRTKLNENFTELYDFWAEADDLYVNEADFVLDEDSRAETDPITDYPTGVSIMPVSAAADWGGYGVASIVATERIGSEGTQRITYGESAIAWEQRIWNSFDDEWGDWIEYAKTDHQHLRILPYPVDFYAESEDITALPDGFSQLPVTAGADWGPNTGEAGHVLIERSGSEGKQTFAVPSTGTSYIRYYTGGAWGAWSSGGGGPEAHAASHTDGTDDIQSATSGQKGLMSSAYATKLDGIEANATADMTASEILTALLTVDTNSSGLNADTLDGLQASAFLQSVPAEYLTETEGNALYKAIGYVPAWSEITSKPATFAPIIGSGAGDAVAGNDARLTDTRTPSDNSVTNAKVHASAAIAESKLDLASDAAAGTASRRTLGTGATQALPGNHSSTTDARTPTAHSHLIADLPVADSGESNANEVVRSNDARLSDARTPAAHNHAGVDITSGTIDVAWIGTGTKNSTTFYRGDGTFAAPAGYRQLLTVAGSDVGNAAVLTYANVTGLTFAVTSGVHYKFEALLDFVTNATTSGVRFSMNGPTLTRGSWMVEIPPASGAAPYVPIINHQVAFDTGAATASVTAVSPNLAIIKGFFICSASGTAAVRFASEVATANTLTIKIGSSLEYWSV